MSRQASLSFLSAFGHEAFSPTSSILHSSPLSLLLNFSRCFHRCVFGCHRGASLLFTHVYPEPLYTYTTHEAGQVIRKQDICGARASEDIYCVAMVTTGLTPLYIHLSKIQRINNGQLVYMSAIHLLMFGSLFVIYPSSWITNSSQAGVYLHIYTCLYIYRKIVPVVRLGFKACAC